MLDWSAEDLVVRSDSRVFGVAGCDWIAPVPNAAFPTSGLRLLSSGVAVSSAVPALPTPVSNIAPSIPITTSSTSCSSSHAANDRSCSGLLPNIRRSTCTHLRLPRRTQLQLTRPRGLPKYAEIAQDVVCCGLDCGLEKVHKFRASPHFIRRNSFLFPPRSKQKVGTKAIGSLQPLTAFQHLILPHHVKLNRTRNTSAPPSFFSTAAVSGFQMC